MLIDNYKMINLLIRKFSIDLLVIGYFLRKVS